MTPADSQAWGVYVHSTRLPAAATGGSKPPANKAKPAEAGSPPPATKRMSRFP
jgi:hypothetical protein